VLDVFSHFFIDPLLDPKSVNKEVNAVNSEYEIGVSGDERKVSNLFKLIAKDTHPLRKFTTGNLETLNKENGFYHSINL
jgi:insulysin